MGEKSIWRQKVASNNACPFGTKWAGDSPIGSCTNEHNAVYIKFNNVKPDNNYGRKPSNKEHELVSWSLTSLFSTNMAILETKQRT